MDLALPHDSLESSDAPRSAATSESLDDAQRREHMLLAAISDAYALHELVFDAHGAPCDYRFIDVNPAFEQQTGFARADVVGKLHSEVLPGNDSHWLERYAEVVSSGRPSRFTAPSHRLGRYYHVYAYSPGPRQFATIFQEVTDRRQVERELVEAQRKLTAVMEAVPVGITFSHDPRCQHITGNPAAALQFEANLSDNLSASATESTAAGRHLRYFRDGQEVSARDLPLQRAVNEKRIVAPSELLVELPSGRRWMMECSAAPLMDAHGEVVGGVAVTVDVTARHEAEAALREANQRKDRFLAALSHELRNPLAPIKNSLYVLDHVSLASEQGQRAKQVLSRQVHQLSRLVDDLLDITRIVHDKIVLQRERVELCELVRGAVEDQRSLFEANGVRLSLSLPEQPVWSDADATRLAQIVGNLLQNAAKFTPRGGDARVIVELEEACDMVRLRVSDDGVGMSQETLARIFRRFAQADESLERSKGGLGLGLALVKGLVELHGGEVSAHSAGLDKGSEFVVRLPTVLVASPPSHVTSTEQSKAKCRVLVIEDNIDAADSLRDALELGDYAVDVAYTGFEGLKKARALRPDVVFCDVGLPEMNGYEVARAFRTDPALAEVYLVALSGYTRPEDRARAVEAGFDQHLAKPTTFEALFEAIHASGAE